MYNLSMNKPANIIYATNRQARSAYQILDTFEAGLVLTGSEVKSIKTSNLNLKGCFATLQNGELILKNCHVSPYKFGAKTEYDPLRPRKLLLHKKEIAVIIGKLAQKGLTIVPLSVYSRNNKIKVELGIARGKKLHDKREDIKTREQNISIQRLLKR